ncbi:pilus assembly protein TadG-related protein [Novosphingobium tardum]|uniref:Pilus assembly protein TadG-related protein n=1 Tax=Novosphingobium tardum TaxID=1538021 RepID=A0ABV8RPZ6_9SPHN
MRDTVAKLKRLGKRLRKDASGNAIMMLALGMPALIGGAGLAVDTAQWYMWKRELQFAVDQAALAGAWARTDPATENNYATRATQEFNANVSVIEGDTSEPVITLANYAAGTGNSVIVHATVSHELPFSSFLTGSSPSIYAYAQASFEEGNTFTSCLIAVDPDDDGAINIGGNSVLTASCGLAALSTSDEAITVDGNPTVDAGWILAAGGIDQWLKDNTDDTILEHMSGLYDPFKDLQPPNPTESQVARTYNCVKGSTTTKASKKTDVTATYTYWKGEDYNTAVQTTYSKAKSPTTTTHTDSIVIVSNDTVNGTVVTTTVTWTAVNGSSKNTIWEKKTVVTSDTYSGVTSTTTPDQASVLPGTYTGGIKVACNTTFSTGVYILDGGGLEIDGQYSVTGAGVMFVLKNGAYIKINGGSNINLTAIQASDLVARGVTVDQANKLAGMLVFEAKDSSSSNRNRINGNAATVLNGTVYLPNSGVDFLGTATVTSQCLMIAAATINITGDANMSTFCPAGAVEDTVVATQVSRVKLVA